MECPDCGGTDLQQTIPMVVEGQVLDFGGDITEYKCMSCEARFDVGELGLDTSDQGGYDGPPEHHHDTNEEQRGER